MFLQPKREPRQLLYPHWAVKRPPKTSLGASLVAQMVKNLPAMQDARVQSLSQEDSLE